MYYCGNGNKGLRFGKKANGVHAPIFSTPDSLLAIHKLKHPSCIEKMKKVAAKGGVDYKDIQLQVRFNEDTLCEELYASNADFTGFFSEVEEESTLYLNILDALVLHDLLRGKTSLLRVYTVEDKGDDGDAAPLFLVECKWYGAANGNTEEWALEILWFIFEDERERFRELADQYTERIIVANREL